MIVIKSIFYPFFCGRKDSNLFRKTNRFIKLPIKRQSFDFQKEASRRCKRFRLRPGLSLQPGRLQASVRDAFPHFARAYGSGYETSSPNSFAACNAK